MCSCDKANQITLLVSCPPLFTRGWLLIIHYAILWHLRVWLPGNAQMINKKEVWLAFQGNNEGRNGRLK